MKTGRAMGRGSHRRARQTARRGLATLLALMMAVLPGWARVEIKPGFNSFSPDQDIELGREAAQEIEKEVKLVEDPVLNEYINRLGQNLAGFAPHHRYPYQFKLVESDQLNAFALPGGPIYIHTAIVAAADNEAQLAGVMAHEISHVALRHSTNQASKAMLAQAPLAILGGIFGGGGAMGQLASLGIGFGLQSVFLKFSRSAERQSDQLGAQILYDAGYEPQAMAEFFSKLESSGGGGGVEFFSSHPNPGNRRRDVAALIPSLGPQKGFTTGGDEFAEMKRRIEGLPATTTAPASPQQRAAAEPLRRPETPSRSMRQLRADWFGIDYPDNWQAYGEGSSTITLVPPEGIVRTSENAPPALAYGALISLFEAYQEPGRRLTLNNATNQLIRELQRSNPNLRVISSARRFRGPGGEEMLEVTAQGVSPLPGEPERNWIVTSFQPDGLWYAVFISPEADYQSWKPVFQRMLDTIRFP